MPDRKKSSFSFVLILALLLTACTTPGDPGGAVASVPPITIMTFNVENLFDTSDDPGKNDATYLPLTAKTSVEHRAGCEQITVERWRDQCLHYDWSESVLDLKMQALARAILQVDEGRGPDIVVLQEVENLVVLEQLRTAYLADANYRPAVLLEGSDLRGIDVAFLSRLPVVGKPALHPVVHGGIGQARVDDTRGILQTTFRLPDQSLLTGYAVHFPAPYHPTAMREQAYTTLNGLVKDLPADRMVFAAGDFNTTAEEDLEHKMLDRYVRPQWLIAHESCQGCPGSHYYPPKGWSFLDMVLWSRRGGKTTWQMRENGTRLLNQAVGQTTDQGVPNRFDVLTGMGISDHWPLLMTIESEPKQ